MPVLMSTWTISKELRKKKCLVENISLVQQKKDVLMLKNQTVNNNNDNDDDNNNNFIDTEVL